MIKTIGTKYGLLSGAFSASALSLIYVINSDYVIGNLYLIVYFIMLGFMILTAKQIRDTEGGYASFKEILPGVFLAFLIGNAMTILFYYMLLTFIDPRLILKMRELFINDFKAQMNDKSLEDLARLKELEANSFIPSFFDQISTFAIRSLGGFLLSALVALGFKREKPDFID